MDPDLLNPYQHRSSVIHRLPTVLKFVGAIACVIVVVLLPRNAWLADTGIAVALFLIAALSRASLVQLGRRLLLVEFFAVGVAVLSLFQPQGIEVFLAMLVKSTLCLSGMVLLTATTRFSDMLRVLWRLRVPPLLVTTLALMQRYLFLLFDEMGRMIRARRSRTFTGGRLAVWRVAATIIACLFVRASERAERVYAAMCARGWRT